ncbi:MAG: DUF4469 domain-containing protein [Treponemataceae bacterium]|nr:DUF4469 domain-containing protein [Treponemataceae bacterium]
MVTNNSKRKTNFAVKLTPCNLKENTYIARVPRKTITTDQLLDLVVAHNQGIDRYQVDHAMELIRKEIMEQVALGYAVDVMKICTMYVAPMSSVQSLTPEAETVTGFEPRFAANDSIRETLKGTSASVAAVVDSAPQISRIENPIDGSTDGKLKATFSARLKGKKLQVGGENCGIYFIPADADGNAEADEDKWISVPDAFVTRNTAATLEFYIPRTLEIGRNYIIAIRTQVRGTNELKTAVIGYSKIAVTIEE